MKCLHKPVIVSFSEAFEWKLNRTQCAAQEYMLKIATLAFHKTTA